MENGEAVSEMDSELRSGLMEQNIQETGKTERPMEKELSDTQMETSIPAIGQMIKRTVLDAILIKMIKMEPPTREIGKTIYSTGKELRNGLTDLSMTATTNEERSMDLGLTNGKTVHSSLECGSKTKFPVLENIFGLTEENIKVNG